jgi:hypothetical protein
MPHWLNSDMIDHMSSLMDADAFRNDILGKNLLLLEPAFIKEQVDYIFKDIRSHIVNPQSNFTIFIAIDPSYGSKNISQTSIISFVYNTCVDSTLTV